MEKTTDPLNKESINRNKSKRSGGKEKKGVSHGGGANKTERYLEKKTERTIKQKRKSARFPTKKRAPIRRGGKKKTYYEGGTKRGELEKQGGSVRGSNFSEHVTHWKRKFPKGYAGVNPEGNGKQLNLGWNQEKSALKRKHRN